MHFPAIQKALGSHLACFTARRLHATQGQVHNEASINLTGCTAVKLKLSVPQR